MRNSGFQTTKKFNKQQIKPHQRLVVPKKPDVGEQRPYLEPIFPKVRKLKDGGLLIKKFHRQPVNKFLFDVMAGKEQNVMRDNSVSVGDNHRKATRGRNFKYIAVKNKSKRTKKIRIS